MNTHKIKQLQTGGGRKSIYSVKSLIRLYLKKNFNENVLSIKYTRRLVICYVLYFLWATPVKEIARFLHVSENSVYRYVKFSYRYRMTSETFFNELFDLQDFLLKY